jgi:hypothetical protein
MLHGSIGGSGLAIGGGGAELGRTTTSWGGDGGRPKTVLWSFDSDSGRADIPPERCSADDEPERFSAVETAVKNVLLRPDLGRVLSGDAGTELEGLLTGDGSGDAVEGRAA